jgi:hypothetical protein
MNSLVARVRTRLEPLRLSWLDFKVGFRMLARYPGLTLVGTVAIAVAIALGAIYFEAVNKWLTPRLPGRDGHRVVSIGYWDATAMAPERRALHDFAVMRGQVKTVETSVRQSCSSATSPRRTGGSSRSGGPRSRPAHSACSERHLCWAER